MGSGKGGIRQLSGCNCGWDSAAPAWPLPRELRAAESPAAPQRVPPSAAGTAPVGLCRGLAPASAFLPGWCETSSRLLFLNV